MIKNQTPVRLKKRIGRFDSGEIRQITHTSPILYGVQLPDGTIHQMTDDMFTKDEQ
jgi:hypothetical protein